MPGEGQRCRDHAGFVRPQAALVFVQDDITSTHAELTKLREISPNHPVVTILGPAIDKEFQVAVTLRDALGKTGD